MEHTITSKRKLNQLVVDGVVEGRKSAISVDSPMAKSLLGKEVGDEIMVRVGDDDFYWTITKIEYTKPE